MGVLIFSETGSVPTSLEILSFTGPFQLFDRFVEDWNNVLPKLPFNEYFRILVVASIFYFRQITNQLLNIYFYQQGKLYNILLLSIYMFK